jgi:hypothetical protein
MRTFASLGLCLALAGCAASPYDACGLTWTGDEPLAGELVLDHGVTLVGGTYTRSDRSSRLNAGTFTIDVRSDRASEPALAEALDGGLPVCRNLDGQNDQVIYQGEGGPWISTDGAPGTLAIAAEEDGVVIGIVDVVAERNGVTKRLYGAFRLALQP